MGQPPQPTIRDDVPTGEGTRRYTVSTSNRSDIYPLPPRSDWNHELSNRGLLLVCWS